MHSIVLIGYGRFGELLASIFASDFDISVVEPDADRAKLAKTHGIKIIQLADIAAADYIFVAVPISAFEKTISRLAPFVGKGQVVVDFCSVKVRPISVMKKYLPNAQIVGTHPMFGPDSASAGLKGLQVAICPVRVDSDKLEVLKNTWIRKGLQLLEVTPEQHDKDAVYSQAFAYTMAQILLRSNLPDVRLQTKSYEALLQVAELSANDSEQLFHDMLFYNPFLPEMRARLQRSIKETNVLLDDIRQEQLPGA